MVVSCCQYDTILDLHYICNLILIIRQEHIWLFFLVKDLDVMRCNLTNGVLIRVNMIYLM